MDERRGESQGDRQPGVERCQLQFLIEQGDQGRVENERDAHDDHAARQVVAQDVNPVERREGQLAQQHRVDVEMDAAGEAGDQDDGDAEQRRKDQPDGRVLAHEARAHQQLGQANGDDAHGRRGQNQERRLQTAEQEVAQDDAQQHGVADGVAHHGHAAQHQEDPRQGAGHGDDDGDDLNFSRCAHDCSPSPATCNSRARPTPLSVSAHWSGAVRRTRPPNSNARKLLRTPP